MADKAGYRPEEVGAALKFKDLGDGTHGVAVGVNGFVGAAHIANGQGTAGSSSGQIVAARLTRRSVTVRNIHTADSCYIGFGTVTSGNGFLLKAGESIPIDSTAAISAIRAGSSDVTICYLESYD